MLGVKTYAPEYLESCRRHVADDIAAYRAVTGAAGLTMAAAVVEPAFCRNLVLALDRMFVHRLRTVEGKNGNALNEVRMVCDSVLEGDGVFHVEKAIKFVPEKSVLGLKPGDTIRLDLAAVERLADAYLAEMERRFV